MSFLLPVLLVLFISDITSEKCTSSLQDGDLRPGCVEDPNYFKRMTQSINFDFKIVARETEYQFSNETTICYKNVRDILMNYGKDYYYSPNVVVQAIVTSLNIYFKGSCLSPTANFALDNILHEVFNPTTNYASRGCSPDNNADYDYQKELEKSSIPKSWGRTLFLYNNGQNYGPVKCN